MKKNIGKRILFGVGTSALLTLLSLFSISTAKADKYMDEAYQLYFKHHPAWDKFTKQEYYPYPGPVIQYGEDLPVCAAAKELSSYVDSKSVKVLSHGKDGGWLFRTVDFRTDFSMKSESLDYMKRLDEMLRTRNQKLVVVFPPPRALLSSKHIDSNDKPQDYTPEQALAGYKAFLQQLHDAGIAAVDLSGTPEGLEFYHKADTHWTISGSDFVAKTVADFVKKLPEYGDIPNMAFITERVGINRPSIGSYEAALKRICSLNIELWTTPKWVTVASAEGDGASSLLGDSQFPSITLLGTSFSAEDEKYNFVGALKGHLQTDIYNTAIIGGGFGASAERYFASDDYRNHPPKIILWEFLPQHNYNNNDTHNDFRQMLPAVHGACAEKDAVATFSTDISSTTISLFKDIEKSGNQLKDKYLYMEVSNPEQRKLQTEILYADGNADKVELTRSNYTVNDGQYYLEFGNRANTHMLFFNLVTDIPQGHINARLCRYADSKGR